jgi:trimeric autotransporter adhesin
LPAIGGGTTICPLTTTNLTNPASGGVWSSSNTTIATVDATGLVTGVAGGIANINYTVGTSTVSTAITVTSPITGTFSVCTGNSTFLADATTTGIWSSSDPTIATVSPTGEVQGKAAGTVTVSFGRTGACAVTQSVTVNANGLAEINGAGTIAVCVGGGITLTNASGAGAWASSNTNATINAATGAVTGNVAGAATITYTNSGCYKTKSLAITSPTSIKPITGSGTICVGNTTPLLDVTGGGTWSSSNTAIASVIAGGVVTGVSAGTATISYNVSGCAATKVVTVSSATTPITGGAISGVTNVCIGQTLALSNATPGGTWSSNKTSVATVVAGVVTGVATGTAYITYTAAAGCYQTLQIYVNPSSSVGAISGASSLCKGSTTSLIDAVAGGTWQSSDPTIATINAYGTVTGVAAGTATISYTRLSCMQSQVVTVNPIPAAITGAMRECANGGTTTLSDATGVGTWTSSNTAYATVNSSTGVVTGVAAGVATISYTLGTGCYVTAKDTAYGPGAISGGSSACVAPFTYLYLTDPTMGGTWASSTTTVATVGAASGVVTGVSSGTTTISYTATYSAGLSCRVFKVVSVNVAPGPITGNTAVCAGGTTTLADTAASGVWSSSNTAYATVNASTGVVSGIAAGAAYITYTKNGCSKTTNVNVGATLPSISGNTNICTGLATTTVSNATTGGTWSASNANVSITKASATTALVTAASTGAVTISYTVGACSATKTMSVTSNNVTSVAGTPWACTGLTTTLSSGNGAGTWTSADPTIASFSGSTTGTSVAALGVSAGVTVLTYTRTTDGCFKTVVFTSHTQPAAISGVYSLCNKATVTLSDATSGGAWTSSDITIATVSSSGGVTGVSSGDITVTYSLPGGCEVYQPIKVKPMPNAIAGGSAVCQSATTPLTDALPGGLWTSGTTTIATVDATGIVTGVAAGTTTISYAVGSCSVTKAITVGNSSPSFTTSALSICAMGTASSTMSVTPTGGAWTGSDNTIATVSGGVLTGVAAGTMIVTYTLNGCFVTQTETVTANTMTGIAGNTEVCVTGTTTLSDATGSGVWSTANTTIATVGSATGVVTGVASGAALITYGITGGGCRQFLTMNVGNVTPGAIGGSVTTACAGKTFILSDATAGGYWTSSDNTIATVNSLGSVLGVSSGTASISYTLVGCSATQVVTVNLAPAAITGTLIVCASGTTSTLANTVGGGTWTSSNTTLATVDPVTALVTGVAKGSPVITYTLSDGCFATAAVSVGGVPNATINGTTTICNGNTTTLSNSVTGGTWSVSDPSIASVSGAVFTGVYGGTATVSYTTPGCVPATTTITVNYVAGISGTSLICKKDSVTLTNATSSGTWTTSNAAVANLSTNYTGTSNPMVIDGIDVGTATITYTVGSCYATQAVNVVDCGYKQVNNGQAAAETGAQVYSLFPNPSNGAITLSQSVAEDGTMQVSVINYTGVKVYAGAVDFKAGKGQLNLSVAPGMYLVMLKENSGDMHTFKVLIEK